jgi:hypothetical protein
VIHVLLYYLYYYYYHSTGFPSSGICGYHVYSLWYSCSQHILIIRLSNLLSLSEPDVGNLCYDNNNNTSNKEAHVSHLNSPQK